MKLTAVTKQGRRRRWWWSARDEYGRFQAGGQMYATRFEAQEAAKQIAGASWTVDEQEISGSSGTPLASDDGLSQETLDLIEATKLVADQYHVAAVVDATVPDLLWLPTDGEYVVLPDSTWEAVIKDNKVDNLIYQPEILDCDKFATIFDGDLSRALIGSAVGLVVDYSSSHAYNALLTLTNGELVLRAFEPQTDQVTEWGSPGYLAQQGALLL